jgi:ABC-type proline/glycine betaine transport system permease subunit
VYTALAYNNERTTVLAAQFGGYIYTSANGQSFTTLVETSLNWIALAMSGTTTVAAVSGRCRGCRIKIRLFIGLFIISWCQIWSSHLKTYAK